MESKQEKTVNEQLDEQFEQDFGWWTEGQTLGSGIQLELIKAMAARFYRQGYKVGVQKATQEAQSHWHAVGQLLPDHMRH